LGSWNNQFTHVPIGLATQQRKRIDPKGWFWSSALASTGQQGEIGGCGQAGKKDLCVT